MVEQRIGAAKPTVQVFDAHVEGCLDPIKHVVVVGGPWASSFPSRIMQISSEYRSAMSMSCSTVTMVFLCSSLSRRIRFMAS